MRWTAGGRHIHGHRLQRGDAAFGVRMGGKQIVHRPPGERVDDEHMCRCRMTLGILVGNMGRSAGDLAKRRGKPQGIAADLRAAPVCGIFASPADCHLHQHGRQRRDDHGDKGTDPTERAVAVAPAAEKESEIAEHRDGAGERRCYRHGQRIAVLDVRQFMRHDAGHFLRRERVQQAGRGGDGGILGIAAGGEGIRLRAVVEIDARHGQAGIGGEIADHAEKLRRAVLVDSLGIVGRQHHVA